jgi:toxin CptA
MDLIAHPLTLAAALSAAAAMGISIQRGGTCMVSAVDHLVSQGSVRKFTALAECSLWTAALGFAAAGIGLGFAASPAFPLGLATVAGGFLLGLGAWLNGACVFGSIARIGGRDWHYLLTPPGYLAGSLLHAALLGASAPAIPEPAPAGPHPVLLALVIVSALVSLAAYGIERRKGRSISALWDYRHATIAIGFTFVILALLAGPWTYTEALGRAAHGKGWPGWVETGLFAALLAGAVLGGSGLPGPQALTAKRAGLCLAGGALMGLGGSLVPGGNDNLILVGLPALQAHAWVAIAVMTATIATGLNIARPGSKLRLGRSEGRADPA